jgi:membrane-associated phospholipid phosphatase
LTFVILGLLLHLDVFGDPNIRGFFKNDMSIYYPMAKHETVTSVSLVLFSFGVPFVCLVAIWFFVDRIHKNDFINNDTEEEHNNELWAGVPLLASSRGDHTAVLLDNAVPASSPSVNGGTSLSRAPSYRTSPAHGVARRLTGGLHWASNTAGTPRTRKLRFALYQFLVFAFLFSAVILTTNALKSLVGRLRPDFISRCDPDFANPDLVYDADAPWIDAKYAFICRGDDHLVGEGRKSFPSGHSSSALYGALFAVIYLGRRAAARSRRAFGYFALPFVQVVLLCGGLLIAASRSWDNRHHALDILVGAAIGAVGAAMSLYFPMFCPSWELDGSAGKGARAEGLGEDAEAGTETDDAGEVGAGEAGAEGTTALQRATSLNMAHIDV